MCSKCPPPPPNLGIQNSCNAVWHWPMPHGILVHHISPKLLMINHPTNVQTGPTSDEAISCYQVSVCLSVCLSICHKPVFCQNSWMYLHASNVWWLLGTLGEFADSWNPISKPNSALIYHIQLKLWSLLWNSLLFSAKIWLPWQCLRPLQSEISSLDWSTPAPYHRTKKFVNNLYKRISHHFRDMWR